MADRGNDNKNTTSIRFSSLNNSLLAVANIRVKINLPIDQNLLCFGRRNPMSRKVANVFFVPIELNGRHCLSSRLLRPK